MLGTSIDFRENDNNVNSKAHTEIEMVVCHVRRRMATVDEDQRVIRHSGCHPMNRRFEVLFVPREIHQGDDPIGFPGDLVLALSAAGANAILSGNGLPGGPESHEVRRCRRGPSALYLVAVFHDGGPTAPATVVQQGAGQGSDHGALAGIDVAHHRYTQVSCRESLADRELFFRGGSGGRFVGVSPRVGGVALLHDGRGVQQVGFYPLNRQVASGVDALSLVQNRLVLSGEIVVISLGRRLFFFVDVYIVVELVPPVSQQRVFNHHDHDRALVVVADLLSHGNPVGCVLHLVLDHFSFEHDRIQTPRQVLQDSRSLGTGFVVDQRVATIVLDSYPIHARAVALVQTV
mmetsp:Transcript_14628/g.33900  ORF Transcript_14628/g.33900 Transcript_14628/m.33900 type:complete len:347 (-) Transcript_14628:1933-2973(-)